MLQHQTQTSGINVCVLLLLCIHISWNLHAHMTSRWASAFENDCGPKAKRCTKSRTRWRIIHVHIIYRTTTAENFLGSQISSAIAPAYCVTRRQRRWDSKQTMRANGDMDAFGPRLQYIRYLCSALDMTGGRLSSWPKMKLLIRLEYTGFRGTANKLLKTDSLVEYSI